ncbi:MAG TPA: multidrug transporter, partial [Planctomycetota bacterium]|nr:multidrug transporter [Planctomycetota bacterium]
LLRVETEGLPLRPGRAVVARLPLPGSARKGVVIPRSAVVRFDGRAWAYVRTAEGKFSRREIALDDPVEKGWFVESPLAPGEEAVVVGAQALLSEEARSRNREF